MSVIYFESKELSTVKAMLKDHCSMGDTDILRGLRYSRAYEELAAFRKDDQDILGNVIDRLFWYVQCANRMAYALNYREEPGLFNDEGNEIAWKDCHALRCNLPELLGALRHIEYNLATNDGRVFLPEVWQEAWDTLRRGVTEKMAEMYEDSLPTRRSTYEIQKEIDSQKNGKVAL